MFFKKLTNFFWKISNKFLFFLAGIYSHSVYITRRTKKAKEK